MKNRLFITCLMGLLYSLTSFVQSASFSALSDTISGGGFIETSIYKEKYKEHNNYYRKAWGDHYRELYYKPIKVRSIELGSSSGLYPVDSVPQLYGLILENNVKQFYLLKLLGGNTSFLESKFFQNVYDRKVFHDTYVGDFIREAYTIEHPYTFIASDRLAKEAGLYSGNPRIFYTSKNQKDTIPDGTSIGDKLVSIYELPNLNSRRVITDTKEMIDKLHSGDTYAVDKEQYIRARLFDMLIGDWNKIPENWSWVSKQDGDTTYYEPIVLDRSSAFAKVDGFAFRQLLGMLGLGFITDYKPEIDKLKKTNQLGLALDVALTANYNESAWIEQAKFLSDHLSDEVIDKAFATLPKEMQDDNLSSIQEKLKSRRTQLEKVAKEYFRLLQKTPVITGTDGDERFLVERTSPNDLHIQIIDAKNDSVLLDRKYSSKNTHEIWVYALDGHDSLESKGEYGGIPVFFIGGKGVNEYDIKNRKNLIIYEGKDQRKNLESLSHLPDARMIIPSDETALDYDYQKLRYTKFSVTPIGIYDSDLGLNLGTSVSYTIYGFRRAPFSRQHQLSFSYNSGFVYQGIFPDFDSRKSFHLSAFVGSPAYFSNFFGFGNETEGHKDKQNTYNRVHLNKYSVTPGLYYTIDKNQEFNISTSFEMYKVNNPDARNRFINEIYADDDPVFKTKYFANINAAYVIDKKMDHFISSFKFSINPGWIINMGDAKKNFAYVMSDIGFNLRLTDRLTFASLLKGTVLFSDKYEFYQAATTELRGFRDNRFIGKQSLYQYSDLRFDMGKLENPLTPLDYGVFVGADHGRVWYPGEDSKKWHTSYGGGWWLTLFKKFTGKFSYFGSKDTGRFAFELGLVF